ncbi:MAG: hypothetical protein AAF958_19025 [Planctomycetota bacterium]
MTDETCYHEAGHAVTAYLLGGIPERLVLGQADDDVLPDHFGQCRVAWPSPDPMRTGPGSRQIDRPYRELMTLVAGLVAEQIYAAVDFDQENLRASAYDLQAAFDLSRAIGGDEALAARRVRAAVASVRQVLQRDSMWAAVAALADELDAHEVLEQAEIAEVLDFWLNRD